MAVQLGIAEEHIKDQEMDGKHLAELEWVRIVVNPVDGVVVLMDSKQSQDVLRRNGSNLCLEVQV